MARKVETIVTLTDDIDGSVADQTLSFSWEGTAYEIDLNKKHAEVLTKALAPYLKAARKVKASSTARPSRRSNQGATARRSADELAAFASWHGKTATLCPAAAA